MSVAAKINEQGDLSIPPDLREKLGYADGEELEMEISGRSLVVRPKKDMETIRRTLDRYAGSMREDFLADGFKDTDDYMRFIRAMITAVNSNVILDLLSGNAESQAAAKSALALAHHSGHVIISTVVYAELAPRYILQEMLDDALRDLDIVVSDLDLVSSYEAGRIFLRYLRRGGTRKRILTDFFDWRTRWEIRRLPAYARYQVFSRSILWR